VETAKVAEAPHTAVPTPASAPNPGACPLQRAKTKPAAMVATMAATSSAAVPPPSAAISVSPTRNPISATAHRRTVPTQKAIPGCGSGRAAIGLSAMPTSNAITMLGIGTTRAT